MQHPHSQTDLDDEQLLNTVFSDYKKGDPEGIPQAKDEDESLFLNSGAKKSIQSVSARAVTVLGYVFLAIFVSVALVRSWHLLAPESWCWLPPEKISAIDNIIIGIGAGLSARFFPGTRLGNGNGADKS